MGREGTTYQGIAFVIRKVDGQAGGNGLLEDCQITGAGGVEEPSGEIKGFGGKGRFGFCDGGGGSGSF